jgi:hypothetical protein
VQTWPYSEHVGPASAGGGGGGGLPPSPGAGPPSPPGGVPASGVPPPPHGPQTPCVLPVGTSQAVPGQQSALFVHPPQAATQVVPEHTYGGVPAGFGTQGDPLQQSALDAHDPPAFTHCAKAHRGTPTLSCLQVSSFSQLPEQQSHDELQLIVCSLHTSPFGLHPIGRRQMPSGPPPLMSHVTDLPDVGGFATPGPPQQSVSFVHRSPTG